MEETVCIVKPDAVLAGLTDRVLGAAEDDGFYVVRRAEKRLTPARARAFYQHLEGTNAFRPAAEFLASGPVVVAVLSKVDAVRAWRERVGPTDPDVARELHPKSIRAQLGVDALRNVAHASATVEDAAREKAFLFPSGPLPGLVPKEYLLETLVMPGLVEALGELYVAQPPDPYAWMSHWFAVNDPPASSSMGEEWPSPCLRPRDALQEAASAKTCHRHSILGAPMYEGTWNFRRCKDRDPVYGVGACDVDGARAVINGLRKSGHREIAWVFLADEPLVYVGGEPVVVALNAAGERADTFKPSLESILTNTETATKNSFELERLEQRLKSDVLASAAAAAEEAGGGAVGFVRVLGRRDTLGNGGRRSAPSVREVDEAQIEHDARRNGGIPDPRALAAAAEVFAALGKTGSPSAYLRAPVAARAAPSERQFERVVSHLLGVDEDAALVFACADGVHRATVGMVAGCLTWRARVGELDAFRDDLSTTESAESKTSFGGSSARPDYDACEFFPVTSMLERLRPLGLSRAKEALDAAIDACDAVFDVRAEAGKCRAAAADARDARKEKMEGDENLVDTGAAAEHARNGLACLERYCWLLLFAAYCVDCGSAGFETTFGAWTRSRWSLRPKTGDMVLA
jgi:nucleoside-diphosphate kinase